MFIRSKIQFFESKSQRINCNDIICKIVYQIKDTIFWKQITTQSAATHRQQTLFIRSKIQFFESKSQRSRQCDNLFEHCLSDQRYNFLKANHNIITILFYPVQIVYQIKDTIFWKQITTETSYANLLEKLFIRSKIQFFESKSQRSLFFRYLRVIVYQIKDTIFWKQITTVPW